ncbi:unnamed protein product [Moneuplotes crassus]|uniref:Uncharacterized protein n=1 Tax=Euplotes crassus TaxID=5936 RepID=A0AAD2D2E8_EUPCR|nr:unnamed protein product [Moneuplotes crassus]
MDKRKKKTRRVLIGRKKTIKKIRRQNSERKFISTQQNLEETKAATDFIFTQRQHKTGQKIVLSKYGIYEPKEESRAFSPQPRLMHLTCLPLQYNLKTIREHPMQPLSDHNNHWLEREVGLVHNSDKVYYSRRNCYIPNEWMMDHNNETEEMLKLNLNNYHKRPILKQRDIWSYVDYDLEAALPEISPVQEFG